MLELYPKEMCNNIFFATFCANMCLFNSLKNLLFQFNKKWLQFVIFLTFGLLSFAVFSHHMSLSCEGAAKLLSTIFTFNKIFMFKFFVSNHLFVCTKISVTLFTFYGFLSLVPCEIKNTCEYLITCITSKLVFSLMSLEQVLSTEYSWTLVTDKFWVLLFQPILYMSLEIFNTFERCVTIFTFCDVFMNIVNMCIQQVFSIENCVALITSIHLFSMYWFIMSYLTSNFGELEMTQTAF